MREGGPGRRQGLGGVAGSVGGCWEDWGGALGEPGLAWCLLGLRACSTFRGK